MQRDRAILETGPIWCLQWRVWMTWEGFWSPRDPKPDFRNLLSIFSEVYSQISKRLGVALWILRGIFAIFSFCGHRVSVFWLWAPARALQVTLISGLTVQLLLFSAIQLNVFTLLLDMDIAFILLNEEIHAVAAPGFWKRRVWVFWNALLLWPFSDADPLANGI